MGIRCWVVLGHCCKGRLEAGIVVVVVETFLERLTTLGFLFFSLFGKKGMNEGFALMRERGKREGEEWV